MPDVQMSIDPKVAKALNDLMAFVKPFHDHYFSYAVAADSKQMDKLRKYIRKRSHEKGELWKSILFFLNRFVTLTEIPATPAFACDPDMEIVEVLNGMLYDETQVRKALENVMAMAYQANEQRVCFLLKDFIKDQAHHELKIDKMRTLWGELNHDIHEFQEEM